ncbi:MAG: hypothetical protein ACLSHG_07140 [Oscillospiraceae bacterium]
MPRCWSLFAVKRPAGRRVENDVAAYLPADSETRQGLDIMEQEFQTYGSAKILLRDTDADAAAASGGADPRGRRVDSCAYTMDDTQCAAGALALSDLEGSGRVRADRAGPARPARRQRRGTFIPPRATASPIRSTAKIARPARHRWRSSSAPIGRSPFTSLDVCRGRSSRSSSRFLAAALIINGHELRLRHDLRSCPTPRGHPAAAGPRRWIYAIIFCNRYKQAA